MARNPFRRIVRVLAYSPPVTAFVGFTKRLVIPGFDGLPLYDVADFFFTGIHKGSIKTRASSLAFSFFLALFPAIIFLFTLIPYIPIQNFQDQLLELIRNVLPSNAYESTRDTIEDIVKHQRRGLLSLGFLLALYFTSNGFMAMIKGFNTSYHVVESRGPWRRRGAALVLTFILSVLVMLATVLIVFGQTTSKYFVKKHIIKNATQLHIVASTRWAIILALILFSISFLYYYGPAVKKRWKLFSAGSTLATALTICTSIGFAYYVNNFANYNKLYGSIGTLIVVMLWIYFNSVILILGFELNASIDNAKRRKFATKE
jgi:membrane protein